MRSRRDPLVVLSLFGILFLTSADNQLLIPLLPLLSRELEVSFGRLGHVFSLYALGAAFFTLLVGPLTDRRGRVPFLRWGTGCFCLLSLATSQAAGLGALMGLRTGTGMAAGLLSACTVGLVGDHFAYAKRGRVMGLVLSAYFVALLVGVPVSAWVAENWSWSRVFQLSALLAGGLWLALLFVPSVHPGNTAVEGGYFARYPRLLAGTPTRTALFASFAVSGGTLAFLTFIAAHLNERFGLSAVSVSMLFLVAGVAAAVASPLAGWLSDRWTKRRVFLVTNTIAVGPLLLLDRLEWGAVLIGLFFLLSLAIAFRQTALQTLQSELTGADERGSFLALRNGFSQLGISVSVLAAGRLYESYGYGAVTLLAAALTATAGLLMLRVAEPDRTRKKGS